MSTGDVREPTLLVLTALASGPRHGYALIEAVAELSDGRVHLRPGSLYGTLDRLAREDLVREVGSEVVAGRHRRYYELTEGGLDTLTAQVARLEQLAATATQALRRRRPPRGDGLAAGELDWAGGAA